MPTPLRVLILEDQPADAELVLHELRRADFEPQWARVASEGDYLAQLEARPEIILADFNMPRFDAMRALRLLQEQEVDIPFIIVSGSISEELAVECMKQGAADYLLKDRLGRLGQAVTRALEEQRVRQERRRAEQELWEATALTRTLVDSSPLAIIALDTQGKVQSWNAAAERIFGWTAEEVLGSPPPLFPPGHEEEAAAIAARVEAGEMLEGLEVQRCSKDGTLVEVSLSVAPFYDGAGAYIGRIGIVADITRRKRAEAEVQRQLERLAALRTIDLAISSSLDVRVILNILLDQVVTQLRVDAASILLLDPVTQRLEYAAGRGFRTRLIETTSLRLNESSAGRAILERRLIHIPRLAALPAFTRQLLTQEEDFVGYWCEPLIAKGQPKGVLEIFLRDWQEPSHAWVDFLQSLAGQAAIAIDNVGLYDSLQRSNLELTMSYDATLEGWVRALDMRDKETEGHSQRVVELTARLARAMGVAEEELAHLRRGALLHDIGKMAVPDEILHKPGPLTEEEWAVMRLHPQSAHDFLSGIPYLRPALGIPYCHHERWDGAGYPRGLAGEAIPWGARLFSIVDIWDALRSDRSYRPAWPEAQVREHLRSLAGSHLDPRVVEAFLALDLSGQ